MSEYYTEAPDSKRSFALRAARTFHIAIAECYWDGKDVVLDLKDRGQLDDRIAVELQTARPDDVALILHTSGTPANPKPSH